MSEKKSKGMAQLKQSAREEQENFISFKVFSKDFTRHFYEKQRKRIKQI